MRGGKCKTPPVRVLASEVHHVEQSRTPSVSIRFCNSVSLALSAYHLLPRCVIEIANHIGRFVISGVNDSTSVHCVLFRYPFWRFLHSQPVVRNDAAAALGHRLHPIDHDPDLSKPVCDLLASGH